MSDRGTTNILLAIIATALLFGSGAVLGMMMWAFWMAAGLLALSLLFAGLVAMGKAIQVDLRDGIAALARVSQWLAQRRVRILLMIIGSPLAPVALPVYFWKTARRRNEGVLICALEAALGSVLGLAILLAIISLIGLGSAFVLSG